MPLVRSATLNNFAPLMAAHGLQARVLVAEVGLPPRCLDEPDLMVPAHLVAQLLELGAERANEPALGILMAQSRQLSNLGRLGWLVRHEPTLGAVLEALIQHMPVHNEALTMSVEKASNLVIIREEVTGAGKRPVSQATELIVGATFRILSVLLGASWQPRLVCFSHSAPSRLRAHRAFFGKAVEFGHEFNGIVCNAAGLDAPNPAADPVMARYSQQMLQNELGAGARFSERVRQLVILLLPRGHCRVDVVAQHLGVDRRTVARRLAAEDATFSELVDELRDELLSRHLVERNKPLAEISALLGFSAPSAFARWHQARFNMSARDRREGRRAS